jgi:hypothetical protein
MIEAFRINETDREPFVVAIADPPWGLDGGVDGAIP